MVPARCFLAENLPVAAGDVLGDGPAKVICTVSYRGFLVPIILRFEGFGASDDFDQ